MTAIQIVLRTLTPLWTGGVDQTCDRLHETGILGSLRWWYEAIVRGLGGYACDPTAESSEARCSFDNKAYEKAKTRTRKHEEEAIREGLRTVCPVCYVFGCTGWARLFQLRAVEVPSTPLHFRTTLSTNRGWLGRVFGGEQQRIDSVQVPYGDLRFQLATRRYNPEYAKNQFALVLRIAADYGGIGARMQHGFGQFVFPSELSDISLTDALDQLVTMIQSRTLRSDGPPVDTPFNLRNFVALFYRIPKAKLSDFTRSRAHVGSAVKATEEYYLPCVFDLRYKGSGKWGMRRWLKKEKRWRESDDPERLEELDLLLGPRSQWGSRGREQKIEESLRTAGRVFFSMPYRIDEDTYALRIWAFLAPELQHRLPTVSDLGDLCREYMRYVLGVEPESIISGEQILQQLQGGGKGVGS
ncbi:MAG TPA: type III-B CRISPR module RAMP protein Cmr1 [Thermoflexus sp.]|nr:type III-B CRISPR module RAMP protein Cmr1 [Thermoflexus sp.]